MIVLYITPSILLPCLRNTSVAVSTFAVQRMPPSSTSSTEETPLSTREKLRRYAGKREKNRLQRLVPGLSCGSWAQHFSINDEIGWGIPSNDNRYILDKAVLN